MRIDFTKVSDEEVTYELLPEGKHILKVTNVEEKESAKGNPYWAITFADKDDNRVFENLTFTEKTYNRVKKMYKLLGLDVNGTFDYQPEDILGLYMNAEILIENYVHNGVDKQKNVINLWESEPYTKGKPKTKKALDEEIDVESELPF